jgi:hypothetical protein
VVGFVPVVLLGLTRDLRAALWEPILRLQCARLRLVDPHTADHAAVRVRAAAAARRLPTVRHAAYLVATTVFGGAVCCLALLGFLIDAGLLAAPRLVRGDYLDLGPWVVDEPAEAWICTGAGFVAAVLLLALLSAWSALEVLVARTLLDPVVRCWPPMPTVGSAKRCASRTPAPRCWKRKGSSANSSNPNCTTGSSTGSSPCR